MKLNNNQLGINMNKEIFKEVLGKLIIKGAMNFYKQKSRTKK
jgi:hypothetical protein